MKFLDSKEAQAMIEKLVECESTLPIEKLESLAHAILLNAVRVGDSDFLKGSLDFVNHMTMFTTKHSDYLRDDEVTFLDIFKIHKDPVEFKRLGHLFIVLFNALCEHDFIEHLDEDKAIQGYTISLMAAVQIIAAELEVEQ